MKQEEKDLLLKDLCARLPYGIKCRYQHIQDIINGKIIDINMFGRVNIDGHIKDVCDIKPYLFPLSSMTKEQMEELKELCNMYTPDDDYYPYAYKGIVVLYKHALDDNYKFSVYFKTDVIDWLNKNHFDYIGLIPKGLALDATGLNIY